MKRLLLITALLLSASSMYGAKVGELELTNPGSPIEFDGFIPHTDYKFELKYDNTPILSGNLDNGIFYGGDYEFDGLKKKDVVEIDINVWDGALGNDWALIEPSALRDAFSGTGSFELGQSPKVPNMDSGMGGVNFQPAIPEPSTSWLLAGGSIMFYFLRRRR